MTELVDEGAGLAGVRRAVVAVIGAASEPLAAALEEAAFALGRGLVDAGHRLVTGGLGGVMRVVSAGGRASRHCTDGSILGILPGLDAAAANPHVQIVVPSGMQLARNLLVVATGDVVVAVGGGAGTLSEIALAWQLGKPVVAIDGLGGWSERLAGERLDARPRGLILAATTVEAALVHVAELLSQRRQTPGDVGSGWQREGK